MDNIKVELGSTNIYLIGKVNISNNISKNIKINNNGVNVDNIQINESSIFICAYDFNGKYQYKKIIIETCLNINDIFIKYFNNNYIY